MEFRPSPNFDERAGGASPSLIVLHYTGMKTADEALARLCDPAARVSAHYFIGEDGTVLQLVEDEKRAWHAGVSYWRGERDINSRSIGIELVNPGHEFGYRSFPEVQTNTLLELCKIKMQEWGISPAGILAHSDVAPARKADPGEMFPWEALAAQGVGLWPQPGEMDYEAAEGMGSGEFRALLNEFGYDPEAADKDVFTAFHRHFAPEKFTGGFHPQEADAASIARLLSLMCLWVEGGQR